MTTLLAVLAGIWLLLEATTLLVRYGLMKVWRVGNIPGRGGVTLHPLLIFVDNERLVEHEKVHARQMARHTWIGWILRYAFDGRWRVRYEAEAYAVQYPGGGEDPRVWADRYAEKITGELYFPSWWPFGTTPERYFAYSVLMAHIEGRQSGSE